MKKHLLSTLLLASSLCVCAQDNVSSAGAPFLVVTPDARSAAIGGAGVALGEGNYSFYHNAAAIMSDDEPMAGVTYSFVPWRASAGSGYMLNSMGGFDRIDDRQGIVAGFRHFSYPEVEEITSRHRRPKELAIDVGYARRIIDNFSLSLTARYINSNMRAIYDKTAHSVAFDLGAFYTKDIPSMEGADWAVGLRVGNIGTRLKYGEIMQDLPAETKLGGSVFLPFSYNHRLLFAADLGYRMAPSDIEAFNAGGGVEYTFFNHFAARGGYHYGDKAKGDESYATVGVGASTHGLHLDFTWLFAEKGSVLRNNTYWVSFGFSFAL